MSLRYATSFSDYVSRIFPEIAAMFLSKLSLPFQDESFAVRYLNLKFGHMTEDS